MIDRYDALRKKKITIYPLVVRDDTVAWAAKEDLSAFYEMLDKDPDLFGVQVTFAVFDEKTLVATNRIRVLSQSGTSRIVPSYDAKCDYTNRIMASFCICMPEAVLFAAKYGLRPAPEVGTLREIKVIITREGFFISNRGYRLATKASNDRPDSSPSRQWADLAFSQIDLEAAAHQEILQSGERQHFGASVMTVLVPDQASHHAALDATARLKLEMTHILNHQAVMVSARFKLHDNWQMPSLIKAG